LQVGKYLAPRMKEWENTELRGLSIVNHQRHLPPAQREHVNVFQDDVLTTAREHQITLLTTWELFVLARNARRLGWSHEQVRHIFYADGRPDVVPSHYESIGVIEQRWPKPNAFSVLLTGELNLGDSLAVERDGECFEGTVSSVQLDDGPVTTAAPGSRVGIGSDLAVEALRDGDRVFVVRR